jgi:hypothetical protein
LLGFLFGLGCRIAPAAEVVLPDPLKIGGETYQSAVPVSRDAAYLTFRHASGTAHVLIATLPENVRALLDYDAQAAEVQLEAEREKQRRAEAVKPRPTMTIHGRLVANTEKGLFVAVTRETGRTKAVQQWSGGAVTKSESSETTEAAATNDTTRIVTTDVPVYETVYFLVTGARNAEFLQPGAPIDYVVTPGATDGYRGCEATTAGFVKSLRD